MIYGCIGEKLKHSFSKEIHNKLFDYDYEICEIPRDELCEFLEKKEFKAINVTIPYKEAVLPHLDFVSQTAKKIGAVNTVVNKNGRLYGYNTDFFGMRALLNKNNIELKGKKVLILGSGGTSKTAIEVAESLNAAECVIVSRNKGEHTVTYEQMYERHTDADVIINTTPLGMYPNIDGVAADLAEFKSLSAVVDAVYNPLKSRLIKTAEEKNIKAVGGLYMLVYQAAVAAEKFTGESVSEDKINAVYKSILKQKQNVVLIGMASCGKSTIGKILAQMLGFEFVDSDEEIVKKIGMPIAEFFKRFGEERFRKIESETIFELSKRQGTVIATGGGVILRPQNCFYLSQNGRIYFIDRPLESLTATADRPLSANYNDLVKRFNERYDVYKKYCDFHLKAGNDACENADKIKEEFLNEDTDN